MRKLIGTKQGFSKIFWLMGLFSTFTAVKIADVTVFYILMLTATIVKIFASKGRVKVGDKLLLIFGCTVFVSCFFSVLNTDMDDYWIAANIKKTLVFFATCFSFGFFYNDREKESYEDPFLKGLYISTICQMVWGIMQFLLWSVAHIELNKFIFHDLLGQELVNSTWSFIYETGTLRLTGISWEPAYFSMAMIAGYLLSKKVYVKLMFALVCLLSTSRTGIILLAIAFLLESGFLEPGTKISKKNITRFWKIVGVGIVGAVVLFLTSSKARNIVNEAWISLIMWNATTSGGTHFNYLRYVSNILSQSSLINNIFGYGIASSGFPYMKYYNLEFGAYTTAWSPESDLINMLFGLGIVGLFSYYIMLFRSILRAKNKQIRNILLCVLVGGVFYIYYGTWAFFLIILNNRNIRKIKKFSINE